MSSVTCEHEREGSELEQKVQVPMEEVEPFAKRLAKAIGKESVRSFARKCGISDAVLRAYLAGRSEPTRPVLISLAENAEVSIEWLVKGEGPMRPGEGIEEETFSEDEFALVPLLDVEVSAGYGAVVEEERVVCKLAFRKDWLAEEGLLGRHLTVVTARGDSMEPNIKEGDVLLVDTWITPDGCRLQPSRLADGIYIIRMDGELIVKRLQNDFQGGVFIRSDNPAYKEIHVPGERIDALDVVGKVVWFGRRV